MIEVVNIARTPDFGKRPGDCYIGRNFWYKGTHLPASKYANPFKIGQGGHTRESVLRVYTDYLYESGLAQQVQADLAGVNRLGCWCAPQPCHGDILAAICEQGADAYLEGLHAHQ